MRITYFILFLFLTFSNTFSIVFLDPVVNEVLSHLKKDSTNNYAFLKGFSDHRIDNNNTFFSLGFVSSSINPRLEDKDHYSTTVPFINLSYKNFYSFGGINNGYNIYRGEKLILNIASQYRFSGHSKSDFDSYLKEVPEVHDPIMIGLSASYPIGTFLITSNILHNTRGDNDENTAAIGVLSEVPLTNFILLGYLSYELMSNSYTNNYFGIPNSNYTTPKIKAYDIKGIGSAFRFTGVLVYSFNKNIDIFTYFYSERFSQNIKNSPLINDNDLNMIGIGTTYTF